MHTAIARIFLALMLLGQALPASAAEGSLPSAAARQAGGPGITESWKEHGGARLYWNALVQPRQLRMGGARFNDPAAVPELTLSPPPAPAKAVRRVSGRKARAGKPPQAAAGPAPKGVGSTALKTPAATGTSGSAPSAASRPAPPASPAPVPPLSAAPPAKAGTAVTAMPPPVPALDRAEAATPAPVMVPPYTAEKPPSVGSVRDGAGAAPSLPGAAPAPPATGF